MMAINISRLRNCRVGGVGLAEVLIVIGIVSSVAIYMSYKFRAMDSHLAVKMALEHTDDLRLQLYMERMTDTRPKSCRSEEDKSSTTTVSIIINFKDFQFYELAMVLKCLYARTPMSLVDKIIIVDDGTKASYIHKDLLKYAEKYEKLHIIRTNTTVGRAVARMRAARTSKSPILVFLDTTTLVNQGWLQPLVNKILDNKFSIAVPHLDYITEANTYNLMEAPDNVVHLFTWGLSIVRFKVNSEVTDNAIKTPVMRGNAFAVNRKYFLTLGGYDETLGPGGGEDVELSFRIWMCRGSIVTALCSRVGVIGLPDLVRTQSKQNYNIITKLWIPDVSYKQFLSANDVTADKRNALALRNRKEYVEGLKCYPFDWYLKNVASFLVLPPLNFLKYGILKSKSGLCASPEKERIQLLKCEMKYYDADSFFTLTETGQVMNRGLCLTASTLYYVKMQKCVSVLNDQYWVLTPSGHLKLKRNNECAMHVSDPSPVRGLSNQIIMLGTCKEKEKVFQGWTFEPDAIDE